MDKVHELTKAELMAVDGGSISPFGCVLLGGVAGAAIVAANMWALTTSLIASYNSGCFDFLFAN